MTEQPNLIPKRRFKEFQNTHAWEQRKLGDVIDGLYNGQTPSRFRDDFWNGNINWLSSGELNRSIVKTASEKITEAGQADANLRVVPKNTFVMAITGLEAAGTRGNCGILGIDTTLNQSCMAIYPNKKLLSTQFLFQWYKMVGEDYGIRFTQGTKQQSYNAEIIKDLDICLPKVEEQLKISQLLSELDNLINLHQRKLEKTKVLKSAYLSEMFPAEGEREPKRRFAGFNHAWEHRKLKDTANYFRGSFPQPYGKKEWYDEENGKPFVQVADIGFDLRLNDEPKLKISKLAESKSRYVETGKVIVALQGSIETSIGRVAITQFPSFIDRTILIFDSYKLPIDKQFFAYSIQKIFKREKDSAPGVTISTITKEALSEFQISLPSLDEQRKIGNFIKQLDNTIALYQRKLEKLQNIKKAYLNEMFV